MARKPALTGAAQLKTALSKLRDVPFKKNVDDAIVDGLKPLVDETQSRAPRPSLKTGVGIAKARSATATVRTFLVGFKRGLPMRIAHLVEFGTAPHSMAKGASRRKGLFQDRPPFSPGTPPEPFFRPAYESTKDEVLRRVGGNVWNLFVKAVSKR